MGSVNALDSGRSIAITARGIAQRAWRRARARRPYRYVNDSSQLAGLPMCRFRRSRPLLSPAERFTALAGAFAQAKTAGPRANLQRRGKRPEAALRHAGRASA